MTAPDLIIVDERPNNTTEEIEVTLDEVASSLPDLARSSERMYDEDDTEATCAAICQNVTPLLALLCEQARAGESGDFEIDLSVFRADGCTSKQLQAAGRALSDYEGLSDEEAYPGNGRFSAVVCAADWIVHAVRVARQLGAASWMRIAFSYEKLTPLEVIGRCVTNGAPDAAMALASAELASGVPGSPAPVGASDEGTIWVSMWLRS